MGTGSPFVPLADYLALARAEPELTYLIEGLVPDRGRLLVVAPPNAGKTWLALAIAKAACGEGREVFLVEEEGSRRKLGERLESMALPEGSRFHIAHLAGLKLDDQRARQQLVEALKRHERPVMVLDPLTSLWSGDENDTREANRLRAALDELVNANPSTLLVMLHHTSKATANGDGHEINAPRGSSVFAGWADVMLKLTHAEAPKGYVALSLIVAKNRDGERGARKNIRIELGSGEVTLDDVTGGPEDLDVRIIAALKEAPGGLTKNGITKSVKAKKAAVLATVDDLTAEARIVKVGEVFKLPEVTP
ncbi:MAG: AAA family ATPase [Myxococcaceae bacterium]|nr:AAA family ATPase [Myxococcaceae bacterium]